MGLMSGTSMDGIDVAITDVRADSNNSDAGLDIQLRSFQTIPYSNELQQKLFAMLDRKPAHTSRAAVVRDISALNFMIGEAFAEAALATLRSSKAEVDVIGSHGQTMYHLLHEDGADFFARSTLQIGEPAVIAQRTGITTVADFRVADVARGGQGAPLVSWVDYQLLSSRTENRAVLNIGGIANITLLPARAASSEVIAFDTGPGNMLIDRAVRTLAPQYGRFDRDGSLAAQGTSSAGLLDWLLKHPFFSQPVPKSTGHEDFGDAYFTAVLQRAQQEGCGTQDLLATLTDLTAKTIADAIPLEYQRVIVSGGGAHNALLMKRLAQNLADRRNPSAIERTDNFGIPVDAKEAIAFGLLAFATVRGKAGNLPSATGADEAVILGKIVPGKNFTSLMRNVWQK